MRALSPARPKPRHGPRDGAFSFHLCRAELTAAEKAAALKKRKLLWESLKVQEGSFGTLGSETKREGRPNGFAASTAEATGMSKRSINALQELTKLGAGREG